MTDDSDIPKSVGNTELPPIVLEDKLKKICEQLDILHLQNSRTVTPSEMVHGALYAARAELRKNPDWLAQAVHSLRDTLYPLVGKNKKHSIGAKATKEALKKYGSTRDPELTVKEMGRLFGELSDIAHHGKVPNRPFEEILREFERVLTDALARQSDIHTEIEEFLTQTPS